MVLKNKKILITGGAGFLGKKLVEKYYDQNEITIFSRDENKHYFLKSQYPNLNCIIGDIASQSALINAGKDCNVGIFCASLKQIGAVNDNIAVAKATIVDGALNSRLCAEENGFESACFISTDKSRAATTLYGAMKFVAGESFIVNAEKNKSTKLSVAVYGNVNNSSGSVIPLIWHAIRHRYKLQLYSPEMTRFMLSAEEAIQVIQTALTVSGYNVIPKLNSYRVKDLFELFAEHKGLKYDVGRPRVSEKIHEVMITAEEVPRVTVSKNKQYYLMHYKTLFNEVHFPNTHYSSEDYVISKAELLTHLENNRFYEH